MADSLTIPLSRPILVNGAAVAALAFREPTGLDVQSCGVRFAWLAGNDPKALRKMMNRLTGLPVSAIDRLGAADWCAAYTVVVGFLGNYRSDRDPVRLARDLARAWRVAPSVILALSLSDLVWWEEQTRVVADFEKSRRLFRSLTAGRPS